MRVPLYNPFEEEQTFMPTSNSDDLDAAGLQAARARIERMLPTLVEAGDHRGLADVLGELARICDGLGENLQALSYHRRQLAEVQQLGDTALEATSLLDAARAAAAVGEQWEAEQLFRAAIGHCASLGNLQGQGAALLLLAESRMAWGNTDGAARAAEEAVPLVRGTAAWTESAEQLHQLSGALRFATEAGQVITDLRARRLDPGAMGRTLAERLGDLPDGPARELAQSLAAALGQASHMPRPAPLAPQPTGRDQAAADTRTVDELIAALAGPDQKQRRVAALALGLRGDLAAVEPLIGAARDRSQWVRLAAVGSLGKLKDRRAFDILAERLHHDRDKDVRRSAAAALRQLKDPRAVAALTVGLTDEAAVAESAAKGLRAIKAAPRMDVLLDLLWSGESPTRRWLAAVKLGELGDPSAVLPLLEVAEDTRETDWLRLRALEAAARLGDPRAAESAARILQTYTPSPDIVRDPSGRPGPDLVCMACRVAGRLGGPGMAPVLLALLDDGNPHIRHAAIEALGAAGDSTAIPRLEELQQSDDASVPLEEPEQVGGIFMAGMRLVSLRVAAADAIRRIHRRGT